jgi:hypothetical protein
VGGQSQDLYRQEEAEVRWTDMNPGRIKLRACVQGSLPTHG